MLGYSQVSLRDRRNRAGCCKKLSSAHRLGNLTQKVDNGTADNCTANSLNQNTFINSQALSYDAKGNLLQRPGWAYTWDSHNRHNCSRRGDEADSTDRRDSPPPHVVGYVGARLPASPQSGSLRLTFAYDGRNRCASGPDGVCGHGDKCGCGTN